MQRVIVTTEVSRQAALADGLTVPPPPEPCYGIGPRGGRYLGIGPWRRVVTTEQGWARGTLTVADISTSARYVRPKR